MHCIRCPCSRDQRVAQKDALQDIAGKKISIDDSDGVWVQSRQNFKPKIRN